MCFLSKKIIYCMIYKSSILYIVKYTDSLEEAKIKAGIELRKLDLESKNWTINTSFRAKC